MFCLERFLGWKDRNVFIKDKYPCSTDLEGKSHLLMKSKPPNLINPLIQATFLWYKDKIFQIPGTNGRGLPKFAEK